jgi:ketosteroid isomerase-like protein
MLDELRSAVDALNEGNAEPFLALIDRDSEWRGITRGHLWWKHAPSCRGPDEARDVLQFQRRKRGERQPPITPEFVQVGDKIIGCAASSEPTDRAQGRFMVFTVRDGKIVDMQGFATRHKAERFANGR